MPDVFSFFISVILLYIACRVYVNYNMYLYYKRSDVAIGSLRHVSA